MAFNFLDWQDVTFATILFFGALQGLFYANYTFLILAFIFLIKTQSNEFLKTTIEKKNS